MRRSAFACLTLVTLAACSDEMSSPSALDSAPSLESSASSVVRVVDADEASLRDALSQASVDAGITRIRIKGPDRIAVSEPLVFTGTQALEIVGDGVILDGTGSTGDGLVFTGGGDVRLRKLTVQSFPGSGVVVAIPAAATGTVRVDVQDVQILDNGLHGLWVDDQVTNSDASLAVEVLRSAVLRNGFGGVSDFDGIRVNEGGVGSITYRMRNSDANENGADGLELDETGDGDVLFDIAQSHLDRNGPQDPNDLDDGFDADEIGAGSLRGRIVQTTLNGNYDQGLDLDEDDDGDIDVELRNVIATGNIGENVKFSETGNGSIVTTMVLVDGSGSVEEEGMVLEEEDAGDLHARITRSEFSNNDNEGIQLDQLDAGVGEATLIRVELKDNLGGPLDTDGVSVTQKP